MKTLLVTGGCGFIGSNFVRMLIERGDTRVVNLDKLTYAGNPANLSDLDDNDNYRFVRGDICDREAVSRLMAEESFDAVVNFAAESHVDRSILDAGEFIRTNVMGTQVLLEGAREAKVDRFMQVSTDEVYGSLGPDGFFTEQTPLSPNSPYSASKASADMLVRAYAHTHGMDVVISRCSNNYGPYQFPEKLIPLFIMNASEDKPLPVYGDGQQVRDWIHVRDHCDAVLTVLQEGRGGEVYNVGAKNEMPNLALIREILRQLGKPESLITYVKDRPGHDRRYAIDNTKIETELGWTPSIEFSRGLAETIQWYRDNEAWWKAIQTGEYQSYYDKQYGDR